LKEQLADSLDSDVKYFEVAIEEVKAGIKVLKQCIKEVKKEKELIK
jgi:phage shock protein A